MSRSGSMDIVREMRRADDIFCIFNDNLIMTPVCQIDKRTIVSGNKAMPLHIEGKNLVRSIRSSNNRPGRIVGGISVRSLRIRDNHISHGLNIS